MVRRSARSQTFRLQGPMLTSLPSSPLHFFVRPLDGRVDGRLTGQPLKPPGGPATVMRREGGAERAEKTRRRAAQQHARGGRRREQQHHAECVIRPCSAGERRLMVMRRAVHGRVAGGPADLVVVLVLSVGFIVSVAALHSEFGGLAGLGRADSVQSLRRSPGNSAPAAKPV